MSCRKSFDRIKGPNILTVFTAAVICLADSSLLVGQVSPRSGAVLIGNVRVVIDDSAPVSTTVLLSEKTVTRVEANAHMPAGAIVTDGGGNFLTSRLSLASLSSLSKRSTISYSANSPVSRVSKLRQGARRSHRQGLDCGGFEEGLESDLSVSEVGWRFWKRSCA